jgi:hypothetical protein
LSARATPAAPEEIINPVSRTNQAAGKVFLPPRWHARTQAIQVSLSTQGNEPIELLLEHKAIPSTGSVICVTDRKPAMPQKGTKIRPKEDSDVIS